MFETVTLHYFYRCNQKHLQTRQKRGEKNTNEREKEREKEKSKCNGENGEK